MATKKSSFPTWVQLYFVLASILGLFMIVVGGSLAINTALSQYVFVPQERPIAPPRPVVLEKQFTETENLTEEEQALLDQWEKDYQAWQEQDAQIDYTAENRKRTWATALAMILVGTPVFALHVPFVFKQAK